MCLGVLSGSLPRTVLSRSVRGGGFLGLGNRPRSQAQLGGLSTLDEPQSLLDDEADDRTAETNDDVDTPAAKAAALRRTLAPLQTATARQSWGSYLTSIFFSEGIPTAQRQARKVQQARGSTPLAQGREQQGEPLDDFARIRRAGALADANNDNRLSAEELLSFAEKVRERRRRVLTKEALLRYDTSKDGKVSQSEVAKAAATGDHHEGLSGMDSNEQVRLKFEAADIDQNGELNEKELHAYVHPEVEPRVLEVEIELQFRSTDHDIDGIVTLEEFLVEAKRGEEDAEFSKEDASSDFATHDLDGSKSLDRTEYTEYVKGHVLLHQHVKLAMEAGDGDADGHINLDEELFHRKEYILDSEFVEDYLLFHQRDEL